MVQLLTLLSAVGAVIAAMGAFLSSRATRKAAEAELFSNFMEDYGGAEMREAMDALTDWRSKHKSAWKADFKAALAADDADALAVNNARRLLKYYFLKALRLHDAGYVTKWFLRQVCNVDGINILYDTVEPLDLIANPNERQSQLHRLQQICPRYGQGYTKQAEATGTYERSA